jgi:ACT domain-containing protein
MLVQVKAPIGAVETAKIVLELRSQFPLADWLKHTDLLRSTFYCQKEALVANYQMAKYWQHKGWCKVGQKKVIATIIQRLKGSLIC